MSALWCCLVNLRSLFVPAGVPFGPVAVEVGDDLRVDLDLDFKTACFGGEEKVRPPHASGDRDDPPGCVHAKRRRQANPVV